MLACTPHPGFGTVVVRHVQVDLSTCRERRLAPTPPPSGPTVVVRRHGTRGTQTIVFRGKVVVTLHESYARIPAGAPGPIELQGMSPDRKWILYAIDPQGSASLAADGLVLRAVSVNGGRPREVVGGLLYGDYRSWCGARTLAIVAGGSRLAVDNKRLILIRLPSWTGRNLLPHAYARAFGSVECAPDHRSVVVQEAPQRTDYSLLRPHWRLVRVTLDGKERPLTSPPAGYSDDSPHYSPDGRTVYFVRARKGVGKLYALRGGKLAGPFLSLGFELGYYEHTEWPYSVRR